MTRLIALMVTLCACLAWPAAAAELRLERMVVVMRHGVRPPTQSNADLAKYAAQPWPDWPVAPGELTPHGGETVRLMGQSLRRAYRADRLLPDGCPKGHEVSVWADGTDQRTRKTGQILAEALAPGCDVAVGWAPPSPRDPIFSGAATAECHIDRSRDVKSAAPTPQTTTALADAVSRLQSILAPNACSGGPGTCFTPASAATGVFPASAGLAEDILLEYADGKPMREVGWGRASAADITAIMPIHERAFELLRDNLAASASRGAPMARLVLAAMAGKPLGGGPTAGTKLLAFAGHDTNLVLMASVFGLKWTLPSEPDSTAPSTALAFEVWTDGHARYVRPVIYYETLDQLRSLKPGAARRLPLSFKDCADGPMGSCRLDRLTQRVEAVLPPGCGMF